MSGKEEFLPSIWENEVKNKIRVNWLS